MHDVAAQFEARPDGDVFRARIVLPLGTTPVNDARCGCSWSTTGTRAAAPAQPRRRSARRRRRRSSAGRQRSAGARLKASASATWCCSTSACPAATGCNWPPNSPVRAAAAVVFVTAHVDHALEAFDLHAVDYLTKPVRRERLQAALERAAMRLAQQRAASAPAADPCSSSTRWAGSSACRCARCCT